MALPLVYQNLPLRRSRGMERRGFEEQLHTHTAARQDIRRCGDGGSLEQPGQRASDRADQNRPLQVGACLHGGRLLSSCRAPGCRRAKGGRHQQGGAHTWHPAGSLQDFHLQRACLAKYPICASVTSPAQACAHIHERRPPPPRLAPPCARAGTTCSCSAIRAPSVGCGRWRLGAGLGSWTTTFSKSPRPRATTSCAPPTCCPKGLWVGLGGSWEERGAASLMGADVGEFMFRAAARTALAKHVKHGGENVGCSGTPCCTRRCGGSMAHRRNLCRKWHASRCGAAAYAEHLQGKSAACPALCSLPSSGHQQLSYCCAPSPSVMSCANHFQAGAHGWLAGPANLAGLRSFADLLHQTAQLLRLAVLHCTGLLTCMDAPCPPHSGPPACRAARNSSPLPRPLPAWHPNSDSGWSVSRCASQGRPNLARS